MKRKLSLLILLFAAVGLSQAQQTYTFLTRDTLALQLDVYQPAHPRADHACVVYLFGGGFYEGTRNNKNSEAACQALADRGFVAVAIDYRLFLRQVHYHVGLLQAWTLFDTSITWAVEDCSAAIAYLCAHASQLGIDPSRIILTGNSAGAITVLQTDFCRANALPPAAALPAGFKPAAVVPFSGAILCRSRDFTYRTPPSPTCLFHGTADRVVNYNKLICSPSVRLYGANQVARLLRKQQANYWVVRFQGNGHEIASSLPKNIDLFCAFVDAVLSGHTMQLDATLTDSTIAPNRWTHMSVFDLYKGYYN